MKISTNYKPEKLLFEQPHQGIGHLYLNKDKGLLIACDGASAAFFPVETSPEDETGIISSNITDTVEWQVPKSPFREIIRKGSATVFVDNGTEFDHPDESYPDFNQYMQIVNNIRRSGKLAVSVDTQILYRLSQAIGCKYDHVILLVDEFQKDYKSVILVLPADLENKAFGIIMPVHYNKEKLHEEKPG